MDYRRTKYMKTFYVTTLIKEDEFKQNVRDTVQAEDRQQAADIVIEKYSLKGFEIIKQKVLEL